MPRVNLASNYTFVNGSTTGWGTENSATSAYNTSYAFFGTGSLLVTKAAVNASGAIMTTPIPVTANLPYAISIYARLPLTIPETTAAPLMLSVTWTNSIGSVVGTSSTAVLTVDDDTAWHRLAGVWTAPAGATFISAIRVFQPIAGAAGQQFVLDALLVEQASYVGGFFFTYGQNQQNNIIQKALSRVPQMINGVRLGADISLNELTFNTIDEFGTVWIITDVKGWEGQTAPEMPDIGRGADDGSYDVEGRLTARSLTISGFFIPSNPDAALTAAKDRLVDSINLVRKGGWLRMHSEPTRAAWVRLVAAPDIQTINDRGRTTFSIVVRAPDPIKYHWNDGDPSGLSRLTVPGSSGSSSMTNIGNADVTGVFTITGPAGPGTQIYNARTNETITLSKPLRGQALVGRVITMASYKGTATLTTSAYTGLRAGDQVTLLGLPTPFTTAGKVYTLTAVSDVYPYSFSFPISSADITETAVDGQVTLAVNDVLIVDTYEKKVIYNGEDTGHRYRLVTLTDWLKFGPGYNPVQFFDDALQVNVTNKTITGTTGQLVTTDVHYLRPGDTVLVSLPQTAVLARKSLTSNVVTMTTQDAHGFSVGDTVNVTSVESSDINNKTRNTNVVTITTSAPHGISVGDYITVNLPTTVTPSSKQLTSNVATIATQVAHGFSVNDSITVSLPTTATVSGKQLTSNIATLTTTAAHGYAPGDTIVVTMPAAASITNKQRSGSLAYITTSAAHGFSVGDSVYITLPDTATLTGTRSISAATNLVTFNTTAAHNFSLGDKVTVSVTGVNNTATVTNRAATSTVATLTTSATHNWQVGEKITVSGVGTRYDAVGVFITAVTTNTLSYSLSGATEASTSASGTITNTTVASYYNGSKVVESIPTTTSFTVRAWDQTVDTTAASTSGSVTNTTNQAYNGLKTVQTASSTTFAYNY